MNGVTILFVYAVIMILATVILTKKEMWNASVLEVVLKTG